MAGGLYKRWVNHAGDTMVAHDEGGTGPLVYNLRLRRGWLPVAFYLALNVGGRWFRYRAGRLLVF